MKKLKLMIIGFLILSIISTVGAQQTNTPDPQNLQTLNKIAQEHQNTRKFFSDELTRQRNEFFTQMDSRFDYYERTADNFLTRTAFKLGLMWAGIVMLSIGTYSLFRVRLDKKKNKRFNETVGQLIRQEVSNAMATYKQAHPEPPKDEVRQEQTQEFFKGAQIKRPVIQGQKPLPEIEIEQKRMQQEALLKQQEAIRQAQAMPQPPSPSTEKKGFFARRREKKAVKRLNRLDRQEKFIREQKAKTIRGMGLPLPPSPNGIGGQYPSFPQQPQQKTPTVSMGFEYEVEQ